MRHDLYECRCLSRFYSSTYLNLNFLTRQRIRMRLLQHPYKTERMRLQHNPSAQVPVVLKHPEAGVIDCQPAPSTCQGPCCGTCKDSDIDLVEAGIRLFLTQEWRVDDAYALQISFSRTASSSGVNAKCGSSPWRFFMSHFTGIEACQSHVIPWKTTRQNLEPCE
jgi:hypothetical protein